MASAAEQLAKNISFSSFAKATELRQRLWFTLMALVIYRAGTFIPIPGIDAGQFGEIVRDPGNGILSMVNVLSGGALERVAIFALNVMPYITASIIMQLMTTASKRLAELKKEGEAGRKQINQYTRYLTVILALVQSFGMAMGFQAQQGVVAEPGLYFIVSTVVTLTGGTVFLMWLGEQVTARGVGNGISLIIFAGIVAEFPRIVAQLLEQTQNGTMSGATLLFLAILVAVLIVFIVFIERSQRRLLIQYPKRQQGNRMSGGESSFLPLKLNTAGVIPPIFASSLLLLPATIGNFAANTDSVWLQTINAYIGQGQVGFFVLYSAFIIFFCFFYTSIVFNPDETADNLRRYGGFLPGIRPGKRTAEYLDFVLTRLTVIGAAYLTIVCLFPEILRAYYGIPFYLGGTSLLIVVSVTMDTVAQVQSHLISHQYEGLVKKTKLRGRKR